MSISKIEQIKKLLFGDVPPVPAPVPAPTAAPAAFTDYTMLDGTTCQIDNLAVGGKVTCAGIPATEGDMTLQDGTVISVDKNGIITNVTAAPAAPTAPGMPGIPTDYTKIAAPTTPAQFRDALQKFADTATPDMQSLVVIVKALFERSFGWELKQQEEKALMDSAIANYRTKFERQEEIAKQMFAIVEELSKLPAGKPVEVPNGKVLKMQAQEDRLKQLQANIAKIKATV
jgi:hypothetical protein